MAIVDYYVILSVQRTASVEEIRQAYNRENKIWRPLVDDAEGIIKADAKQHVLFLDEAIAVLSDPQRRVVYDRQLQASSSETHLVPIDLSSLDLIAQAEAYLANHDYYGAAGAAREATKSNSAESWYFLSRANVGLRRLEDALNEARRAVELASRNAAYRSHLGSVYEEMSNLDEALRAYTEASQLSSNLIYPLLISGIWMDKKQPNMALPIIERVYSLQPEDEMTNDYYAEVLIAMAVAVPKAKTADQIFVTSSEEIEKIRHYLSSASRIHHLDADKRKAISDMEAYLYREEQNTFHIFPFISSTKSRLVAGRNGCDATAIIAFSLFSLALIPVILFVEGFAALSVGEIGGAFFAFLASGGLGYLYYKVTWVPGWKKNARITNFENHR